MRDEQMGAKEHDVCEGQRTTRGADVPMSFDLARTRANVVTFNQK